MAAPQVGDVAPEFEATTHDGRLFRLADLRDRKAVVLFFYPRDDTPICTREACAFRDAYAQFQQANAELLGVSRDAVERHDQFAARHRLPYSLISDSSGRVHALYGVRRTLGIFPERVTFVIDRAGIIRLRYSASFAADRHAQEARQALVAISTPS